MSNLEMDPLSIAKSELERTKEEAPPVESSGPAPPQPPLAGKIIQATKQAKEVPAEITGKAEIAGDDHQETDIWWGSYAGRTMTPSYIVCALLTGMVIWGVWLFWPKDEVRPYLERYTTYILIGAIWVFQLIRWGYRIVGIDYRLTTRRLFCQRGFRTATAAINLTDIATIRVERGLLDNYLKVGRLRVVPIDNSRPPILLEGVYNPDQIAALIMKQVQHAHAASIQYQASIGGG
jgi:hypothetical protein